METRIKKWGNSLGIIIPKKEAKRLRLRKGKTVEVRIQEKEKGIGFGILKGKTLKPLKKEIEEHKEFW